MQLIIVHVMPFKKEENPRINNVKFYTQMF